MTIELRVGLTATGHLEGELLEVREDGLLLNAWSLGEGGIAKKRVVFVSYAAMRDVDLEQLDLRLLPEPHGRAGEGASKIKAQHSEKLRLLSRFPQGVSSQILDKLLAAQSQTEVEVIGDN